MAYRHTRALSDMSGEKILDSRDIIARLNELQEEREALESSVEDATSELSDAQDACDEADEGQDKENAETIRESAQENLSNAQDALAEWDEENAEELEALDSINSECEGYGDWEHGETLILDSFREEYVQQYADDIGAEIPEWVSVDWSATADEFFRYDYSTVEIDGNTYYYRA